MIRQDGRTEPGSQLGGMSRRPPGLLSWLRCRSPGAWDLPLIYSCNSKSAGQQGVSVPAWMVSRRQMLWWNERRGDELEKLPLDFIVPLTLSGCGGRQPDVLCYSSTESSLSFPQRCLIDPSANGNPVPWAVELQAAAQMGSRLSPSFTVS